MTIYPVIMCGGSGTRLWPASRPGLPKQFIPLIGERSSFQNTVLRVGVIAGVETPLIVAGTAHKAHLKAQLAELGVTATLLLEPQARDSSAAMAAAALWIARRDPDGIAVFVSADHHVPDAAAFAAAVTRAVEGARAGRIVTLGLAPTSPSTALGYILPAPGDAAVRPVAAFVEKPDAATAARYVAEGYLWNTGNFIVSAATLLNELQAHAPQVLDAVRKALADATADGEVLVLGEAFRTAPKISIDYAVMEKTACASVTPSAFEWMDIGAWDAAHAAMPKDAGGNAGRALFIEASNNLVRAPHDWDIAVVGAEGLAVIVEDKAVLVARLDRSQSVKTAGETFKARPPAPRFASLDEARGWFDRWMGTGVLPVWSALGIDQDNGGFREVLVFDGSEPPRRARVQPRQAWSFAIAGAKGWPGPWRGAVQAGLTAFEGHYRRPDGLFRTLATATGQIVDDEPRLYDQAFALLAWSATGEEDRARDLVSGLEAWRHPAGGWRETGARPFQSNAHMHLFEAALAWETCGRAALWIGIADEIAHLALTRFIDPAGGFLREAFDETWTPAPGDEGRMLEPGHQFEWAHLLKAWGEKRGRPDAVAAARKLFEAGLAGIDPARGVVVDGLWDDLSVREARARLWPQTEYLKAAVAFGEDAHALCAINAIHRYLHPEARGVWFDKMTPEGDLAPEPPPASTLYHITGAWLALCGPGKVG